MYQRGNCIYVLTCKTFRAKGLYKIGMTKNLNSRIKYYKTAFPSKVVVISHRYIQPMKLAENNVKYLLRYDRCEEEGGTEWFRTFDVSSFVNLIDRVCNFLEEEKPKKSCYGRLLEYLYFWRSY